MLSMKHNMRMGWKKKDKLRSSCCATLLGGGLKSWFKTRALQVAAEDRHSLHHLGLKKFPV